MKNINRINIAKNTIDEITIFDSEFTRWLDAHGADDTDLIKICADVPAGKNQDLEEARVHQDMTHFLAEGYHLNGKTYRCIMLTASDGRKATSTWVNEKFVQELGTWMYCGLRPSEVMLAVNKFMAYLGLLASASKSFEEVFGRSIDIRRVAVVKDAYVKVNGIVDYTTMTSVNTNVEREAEICAFDGFGIINAELTNNKSQTLRGPWMKIFAQATNWNALKKFGSTFVDFWGTTRKLEDVDLIVTESCFKAAKLYRSWKQYCDAFEALGHRICVCVQEHQPKLKGMPYQQGQTLSGDEYDADLFAEYANTTVAKYSEADEAASLLPVYQRKVAKLYHALLKEVHTARTIQEKYTSKRIDMLGGRIPELGFNAFLAPDPVAFAQHLFGKPIAGALKAGECFCSNCAEGEVDVTRNPHLDHAHVILNNVSRIPLAKGPTMFINIWDFTTLRLRADYDGDHVWYSQNPMLIDLVKKTNEKLGNITIDWDAPKAPKTKINRAAIAEFVSNLLHGSEIGLYADALTKMWNSGYDRNVCDWLTYAGNVLIDAAKHGSVKIEKPEAVKELDGASLPMFCRYAKADKEHPADSKYWDELKKSGAPRTAFSGSFLDMYSQKISEKVPEILSVGGIDDEIFDSTVLMVKPDRKLGKLTWLSRKAMSYDQETGKYEDGGLFQQIAFRHADEWKKVVKADAQIHHAEWEELKKQEALREMIQYARDQYEGDAFVQSLSDEEILEGVYDIVARNIFNTKMSEGMDTVVKNAFWRIFGEKAYSIVCEKLGEQAILADFSDLDDEDF